MLPASQLLECVFGCNNPHLFATFGEKTFIPIDHGIVVVEGGKQRHWMPIPAGKYLIDQVVVSTTGILCITEKRLQVTLHFFDATSLQPLCAVETDLHVCLTSAVFSAKGDELYVLSTVPNSVVSVFRCSGNDDDYGAAGKIDVTRNTAPLSVIPADTPENSAKFVVRYKDELLGFSQVNPEFDFDISFVCGATTDVACALGSDSLCYVTSERVLCTYLYDSRVRREICVLPCSSQPTALTVKDSTAFIGTSTGQLLAVNLSNGSLMSIPQLPLASQVLKLETTVFSKLLVGSNEGLFSIKLSPPQDSEDRTQLVKGWRTSTGLKCLGTVDASQAVWVLRDGSFLVHTKESVSEFLTGTVKAVAVDACLLNCARLLILYNDAVLRCFNIKNGEEVWSHECTECSPKFMETDGRGNVACCGADTIRFLLCDGDAVVDRGIVHAALLAAMSLARWVPNEASVLAVCENGDVFLVERPTDGSAETFHAAEALVKNAWRLEFPVTDALVCHVTPDLINIFAHSVDHDSKVYALDRRYEGETKFARPLFLLGDHVSGGSCLIRLSESSILSCGRDGHIVARDLTPYQTQLPPAPPWREKRKPLWVCAARSSFLGGIASAAVFDNGAKLICSGNDTVLHCFSLRADSTSGGTWEEPAWKRGEVAGAAADVDKEASSTLSSVAAPEREALHNDLTRVREAWAKVMREKDGDVPLEALVTGEQRAAFMVECDNAVHEMQERQYYHSLLNDYLQDTIKLRCCDSMKVPRMKVVSMNVKGLQVHNFHLHHTTCKDASLARKALFLRQLQKKIQGGRRTSINVRSALQAGPAVGDSDRASAEYSDAMVNEADVYTQSRMAVQSLLVRGRELVVKETFNAHFQELQEAKRNLVAQIEERTLRCVTISKQLGELPAPLYTPLIDPEEDPDSLFRVDDTELSSEAQALIVPSEGVAVVSAVNEAALHLWMDGLEKEMEHLEVDVPLPEFADDSREAFVPPEERTEEQLRALEVYTKKLKEEQERVNARKDALRSEFTLLQEKNREAAATLDEQLKSVRQSRLNAVEEVDEAELQLALLFEHRLCTLASQRQHRLCKPKVEMLRDEMVGAQSWLTQQKRAFAAAQSRRNDVENQMHSYAASTHASYPFSDGAAGEKLHRRFVRWLRRFEDGKAPLPDANVLMADCNAEHWSAFCRHCEDVAGVQRVLRAADAEAERVAEEVSKAQQHCDSIAKRIEALNREMHAVRDRWVTANLDTHLLCHLHQGQIQDERATTCTAFSTFNLRWRDDVTQYNDLILASDAQSRALLERISQRRKLMKRLAWETEKLQYDAGTRQIELRQLHTLRVTRQMQEYINGDEGLSEEEKIASIQRHMQLVEANMERKIDDLKAVAKRMRMQIAERATENVIVGRQVGEVSSTVRDSAAVYQLIGTHADGSNTYLARAKEIFETSELEELARSQQEELVRLKREVDRLRERTFPSFAVVSKHTR
ncbi:hypothetical protein ABB37_09236 [Leptomonas pyrrhocoris]|uniref:Cilia- and flagella-associated protein 43 n=1 Tax=Leptomonas pyrrhocoris TaxID=157538 RepID=A0A0M9FRN4_LEPPY|nr:hypothetical protein ABB37_09236 [Leptomonas pyrrhocoris]KPA74617.1 hypothetical protein ABB37_09236 [Leptomonas pyrrhocoris]|eukprot:XP_015653056.1 hypothetical protein ABB37_09236 [Leptomonas pyrrhocoris]